MSPLLDFSKKVVLVTGSTKHIGRATAELFAAHGATVILNSRSADDITRTLNEFRAKGYAAEGIRADVSKEEEVDEMVKKIRDQFGRLDVVVNNAAARSSDNRTHDGLNKSDWDEMLRTNVFGVFNVSRAALQVMKLHKAGTIINISSGTAFGKHLAIASLPYAASKGAVISFTKGLAKELGGSGVRVNAVVPPLLSPQGVPDYEQHVYQNVATSSPLRRLVTAEDVAAVILFLASEMSRAITGEVIALGGINNSTTEF